MHPLFVIGIPFAKYIGKLYMNEAKRRIAVKNLKIVMGRDPANWEIEECFANHGLYMWELIAYSTFMRELAERNVVIQNLSFLKRIIEGGMSVCTFSAHIATPEVAGIFMSKAGYKIGIIVEELEGTIEDVIFKFIRERLALKPIKATRVNDMFEFLKSPAILTAITDRIAGREPKKTDVVQFFGRKAYIPTGIVKLAKRSGAYLAPFTTRRIKPGVFHVEIFEPFKVDNENESKKALLRNLEKIISSNPLQWQAFYNIFL